MAKLPQSRVLYDTDTTLQRVSYCRSRSRFLITSFQLGMLSRLLSSITWSVAFWYMGLGRNNSRPFPVPTNPYHPTTEDSFVEETDEFMSGVRLFLEDELTGEMVLKKTALLDEEEDIDNIYENLTLPEGMTELLIKNVSCLLCNTYHLTCTWDSMNIPSGTRYSTSVFQNEEFTKCDSFNNKDDKVVGCQGFISETEDFLLHINLSLSTFLYSHTQEFDPADIAKLNPPRIETASFIDGSLHLAWHKPLDIPEKCFRYQLRINNGSELRNLLHIRTHIIHDLDLTKTYVLEMRVTKTDSCRINNIWSDWCRPVEVNPPGRPGETHNTISLGVPVFILAIFLLYCGIRILQRLFPPVPSPPMKIMKLLEKDDIIQVMQLKYVEVITEVEDGSEGEYVNACV